MVSIIAKLTFKADKAEEALLLLQDLLPQVAKEEGTLHYTLNRSASSPNSIVIIERYVDQGAFDAHSRAPYLREFFAKLPPLLDGKPEISILEELCGICINGG